MILEAEPGRCTTLAVARATSTCRTGSAAARCRCRPIATITEQAGAAADHATSAQFPAATVAFNLAPGVVAGRRRSTRSSRRPGEIGCRPASPRTFQGAAGAFQNSLSNELLLILAAIVTRLHRAGRALRELHPPAHDPVDPAVGGRRRAAGADGRPATTSTSIGIIGIILLIGIVKKNAIMMIDFALEAERDEGKTPREAIHQAALLRFRPILMTTMAALFGALPLMLGTRHRLGAAPSAGHRDRRRPDRQPGADAVHHAGDLPRASTGWRARGVGATREPRAPSPRDAGRRRSAVNLVGALHPRGRSRTIAADDRHRAGRASRAFFVLPVSPLPQVDFPTISVSGQPAGRQPGHDGDHASPRRWSAISAPIADVNEMTSHSSLGSTRITLQFDLNRDIDGAARDVQAAINAARADLPTTPAQQPDLPQGQPGRRADHDPGADLGDAARRGQIYDAASNVRAAEAVAGRRASATSRSAAASLPAVRVELQPARAEQLRHRPGGRARRACQPPTPTARRARSTSATSATRSTPTTRPARPPTTATLVVAYRNGARGAAVATSPRSSTASRTCATLGLVNGKPAVLVHRLPRSRAPTSSRRSTACKALLPQLQAPLPPRHRHRRSPSTAPTTIRASLHEVELHAADRRSLLVMLVVFVVPAQRARHADPGGGGAGLADRHLRRRCTCWASASTTCR